MNPAPTLGTRRKLLLCAVAAIGVLVCAEIGLRLAGFDPMGKMRSAEGGWRHRLVRRSADPAIAYELIPGAHVEAWDAEVAVNSHGFLGRERPTAKPADVRRIVALGDSITFGAGLVERDTWPAQLEAALREAGATVEVLNLGVPGYDTLQEARRLEGVGLAFDPDLVVVAWAINDLGTVAIPLDFLDKLARYDHWIYSARVAQWLGLRLDALRVARGTSAMNEDGAFQSANPHDIADVSADAELLAAARELELRLEELGVDRDQHEELWWYASPVHLGRMRREFEVLAGVAAERALPVLVMVVPYLGEEELAAEYDRAYALVEREARRAGLDALQTSAQVRMHHNALMRERPLDRAHYSTKGCSVLARALGRHLADSGWLDE